MKRIGGRWLAEEKQQMERDIAVILAVPEPEPKRATFTIADSLTDSDRQNWFVFRAMLPEHR